MTNTTISAADQALLFTDARTTYNWTKQDVPDAKLEEAWNLAKFGPTAMNCQPLRFRVVRSQADKDRLRPLMQPGNQEKIDAAPVNLILGWNPTFFKELGRFFPAMPDVATMIGNDPNMAEPMGNNNAWLQAGYLIMALRAVGLSVGPMNGADLQAIDDEFFADCGCHAFCILNVGYAADPAADFPRSPRLTWEEVSGCGA